MGDSAIDSTKPALEAMFHDPFVFFKAYFGLFTVYLKFAFVIVYIIATPFMWFFNLGRFSDKPKAVTPKANNSIVAEVDERSAERARLFVKKMSN